MTSVSNLVRAAGARDPQTSLTVLTVWQPWATLIAIGAKPYEFRSWRPPSWLVGQRMAIHAGARPVKITEVRALLVRLHSNDWAKTGLKREPAIKLLEGLKAGNSLVHSAILCSARVGDPVSGFDAVTGMGAVINDSDRDQHANWGWPMLDVEEMLHLNVSGKQGLWKWERPSRPWEAPEVAL